MPAFVKKEKKKKMYIFLGCINQLKIHRNKNICAAAKQESDLKSI